MTARRHQRTAEEDSFVAERIRLLTASLTKPDEHPFESVLSRIEAETEDDERTGRCWVGAVRHLRDTGYLSGNQADAVIVKIAASVAADRERTAATPEEREAIRLGVLRDFGESDLAQLLAGEGDRYRDEMSRSFCHLLRKGHWRSARGRVTYEEMARPWRESRRTPKTPTDHFDDEAERAFLADERENDFEEITADADWWRQATDAGAVWSVNAVLRFAVAESVGNRDGNGDAWIASIQRAREEGVIETDLAYLLLDRVAGAMVGADSSVKLRQELKREILFERGEEEMVLEMEENGEEFRERVAAARREWRVER